tara:strand:- start:6342 stop:8312 length:1971 start_codon:yes stop_codon:yes gene_type:complete
MGERFDERLAKPEDHPMTACKHGRARLERAFAGGLPVAERMALEQHATTCERCAVELERVDALTEALGTLPEPPVERVNLDDVLARIGSAIDADNAPVHDLATHRRRWAAAVPIAAVAIAAAAVLLIVMGTKWWSPGTSNSTIADGDSDRSEPAVDGPDVDESDAGPTNLVDNTPQLADASDAATTTTPPTWEHLPPTDFDASRHASVRDAVYAALIECSTDADPLGDAAWIEALEVRAAEVGQDWPLAELARSFLTDDDPAVVRAAARVIGRRGGRIGAKSLERLLQDASVREVALLALDELGDIGLPMLARAFWHPDHQDLVAQRVASHSPERRRAFVTRAISLAPRKNTGFVGTTRMLDWLDAEDPADVAWMLDMARDRRFDPSALIAALADSTLGRARLTGQVRDRNSRLPELFRIDAASHLAFPDAVEWLRVRAQAGRHRSEALMALARVPGPEALEALLRVEDARSVDPALFLQAWTTAVAVDDGRLEQVARSWGRDRDHCESLAQLLVLTDTPGAHRALLQLCSWPGLPETVARDAMLQLVRPGAPLDLTGDVQVLYERIDPERASLAAICVLIVHTHGGEAAVRDLLDPASPLTEPTGHRTGDTRVDRIVQRLESDARRGARETLWLLERDLEPVLHARDQRDPRTQP